MPHAMKVTSVFKEFNTTENGLSSAEVSARLKKYGLNELKKKKKIHPLQIFISQFTSFLILILIVALIISTIVGEYVDAVVILIIVVLNGVFGFIQEYKAEKAIEALKKLASLKTKVIRNGKEVEVDSTELVPGDIVMLETGDKIAADCRLIESIQIQSDESSLTGESVPVKKNIEAVKETKLISSKSNMVFMGTIITKGHGKAIVTNTGMNTEIGKIADMVQVEKEELTPLQLNLRDLGKWLGILTIIICLAVFGLSLIRNYSNLSYAYVTEMFLAAVALAVAAIPEGLPAIVTISLAIGVRRMVSRNALMRKLPAVETLGATSVICTDKTGTLTKNQMTVRELYVNEVIKVTGEGYIPEGKFLKGEKQADHSEIELLLRIGALCNDAKLFKEKRWGIFGDPTEACLLVSAKKAGYDYEKLNKQFPRKDEIPFDSKRKMMTTIHKVGNKKFAYTKGAPDNLLKSCTKILDKGKVRKITPKDKKRILDMNKGMADSALRVLGFAYKELDKYKISQVEKELIFVGLQGMIDPPRETVKDSIKRCTDAGIRTIMITGDHKFTAFAIAKEIGLAKEGDEALSGEELDKLSDKQLMVKLNKVSVFARVNPEHKVRILGAVKKKGYVAAMTGDGVNDAPALKKADIGIAMGISGTDVAKEASDMILTDDNFSSIVNAVEEGRGIYSSIRKFTHYLLSCNIGEIFVIFIAILIGWPLPLLAIQILLMNLLTDGFPALALGLDPYPEGLMKEKPRSRKERIITHPFQKIFLIGIIMMIGTLGIFYAYGIDTMKAKTVAFTTLVMFQLFNVLTYRAEGFLVPIKRSMYLIGAVIISLGVHLAIIYTPLNTIFKTVSLGLMDWFWILIVSASLYLIIETKKVFFHEN